MSDQSILFPSIMSSIMALILPLCLPVELYKHISSLYTIRISHMGVALGSIFQL